MPRFTKKIMSPGTYNVKGRKVLITGDRLKKWAENHAKMVAAGLRIPAPWRHDPEAKPIRVEAEDSDIDASNNAGWWDKIWLEGDSLYGSLNVPRQEDASKVGTTVTEVSPLVVKDFADNETTYDESMTHIALVTHPVVKGQDNFLPENEVIAASVAFSSENFLGKVDLTEQDEDSELLFSDMNGEVESPTRASGASLAQALPILREIGLALPDDTNEANFAERIIVAALAIKCSREDASEDESDTPPDDSEEKPSPIAMSKEITKPADPAAKAELSYQQKGELAFARNLIKTQYSDRIKNCVSSGRIAPRQIETIKPLLETVEIAFSAEGQVLPNPLDSVISAWEAIPENAVLTGHTQASANRQSEEVPSGFQFSAGDFNFDFKEQASPESGGPMSTEDIDEIINGQFKAAGIGS